MRKINKLYTLMLAASVLSFSSCIEEPIPEDSIATSEQLSSSSSALEAAVNGIPSQMAQGYLVYGKQVHETDMAFPQLMIAQTEMLGDMYPEGSNSGYDWYRNYNCFNRDFGENSYFSYLPWYTLYKFVKADNAIISSVNIDDPKVSNEIKGYAGIAYAARAFDYFMLSTFWEPKANIYTDCSKVLGLTVPIVTDTTTAQTAKNNPRATHSEMLKFMLSDLDKAESALKNFTPATKNVPDLAVVYGIKAKVYFWDKDYKNAAKFARLAIENTDGEPMNENEWTDPNSGFTTATSGWMWYIHYDPENMSNLANYVGWASGEADWSYSSLTCPSIDKSLYDHIGKKDFRRKVFLDPERKATDYKTCRDTNFINEAPDYLSLKFRCKGGNFETYSEGGATDVPVMRVEEMYFIEAIAKGLSDGAAAGEDLLNSFMQKYRDPDYNYTGSDVNAFVKEALAQMRVEFWGEGNAFPIAKTLEVGVMQNYTGTNAPEDIFKINCKGIKPNWNFVIPINEIDANVALKGKNNPNPTQSVKIPSPIDKYSE